MGSLFTESAALPEHQGLVSVVTPAHNAEAHIERAVRSVAAQSLPVREHIVVDDGSRDATAAVLERLREEFPHVVYLRQRHRGAGPARNLGIEAAEGRYIAFLDSDDYWDRVKLEQQVEFMEAEEVVFSYGDFLRCDSASGRVVARDALPPVLQYEDLLNACLIGCLTAAYNQERVGKRYMPTLRRGQDWALWLQLTRDGAVARKYPGVHAFYTQRRGSLSSGKIRKGMDMFRIYRDEEQLGTLRSLWHLARHTVHVVSR